MSYLITGLVPTIKHNRDVWLLGFVDFQFSVFSGI